MRAVRQPLARARAPFCDLSATFPRPVPAGARAAPRPRRLQAAHRGQLPPAERGRLPPLDARTDGQPAAARAAAPQAGARDRAEIGPRSARETTPRSVSPLALLRPGPVGASGSHYWVHEDGPAGRRRGSSSGFGYCGGRVTGGGYCGGRGTPRLHLAEVSGSPVFHVTHQVLLPLCSLIASLEEGAAAQVARWWAPHISPYLPKSPHISWSHRLLPYPPQYPNPEEGLPRRWRAGGLTGRSLLSRGSWSCCSSFCPSGSATRSASTTP